MTLDAKFFFEVIVGGYRNLVEEGSSAHDLVHLGGGQEVVGLDKCEVIRILDSSSPVVELGWRIHAINGVRVYFLGLILAEACQDGLHHHFFVLENVLEGVRGVHTGLQVELFELVVDQRYHLERELEVVGVRYLVPEGKASHV